MNKTSDGLAALIHFNIPAGMKARWVKRAQRANKKLTAWIIEQIEGSTMNVYKIPDSLAEQYRGAGHALAAIAGDQVVALRYIDDVAPEAVAEQIADGGPHAAFFVRQWLSTAEAAHTVRELQALGSVSVGMCSAWEFVEL